MKKSLKIPMTPARVKQLRMAYGWTIKEMADELAVSVDTISSWLSGRRKPNGTATKLMNIYLAELERVCPTCRAPLSSRDGTDWCRVCDIALPGDRVAYAMKINH